MNQLELAAQRLATEVYRMQKSGTKVPESMQHAVANLEATLSDEHQKRTPKRY